MTEGAAPNRLTIAWSLDARAELRGIDRQTALDILHCIDRYLATRNGDVKKLKPPMTGGSAAETTASSSSRSANRASPLQASANRRDAYR